MDEETFKKAIRQYEAIRKLGQVNMMNKTMVQRIAHENDFHALVTAIEEDYPKILEKYSEMIEKVDEIPEARPVEASYSTV